MKKIILFFVCVFICASSISCAQESNGDDESFKIICTSHVVADWVENITVDEKANLEVSVLADDGKDMHNFQPSASDVRDIYKCDLLIYIGGESDNWVADMQRNDGFPNSLRLLDVVEGQTCDDCLEDEHHHVHDENPDEHIWLSFENAKICLEKIYDKICELYGEYEKLQGNLTEYLTLIDDLQNQYKRSVENAQYKTIVFADRFPFIYLMNELGLEYCAAFPGCSSESAAGFDTIITLAKKVDENKLPCVLVIEDSQVGIAEKVVEYVSDDSVQILVVDSMQIYDAADEFDYLSVMKKNLEVFKMALGVE